MGKVTTNFDFSKFDIGGKGAKAGDGVLTGAEVTRAQRAGYTVWDGYKKTDPTPAEYLKGLPIAGISRSIAELTSNNAAYYAATVIDGLLLPVTLPVSGIMAAVNDQNK